MKKVYEAPVVHLEQFVANEYIAACGDENKVYKFTCDAGGGKSGYVYLETNGVEGLQTEDEWGWDGGRPVLVTPADEYLSGYHACGTTHEASTTDAFLDGYYVSGGKTTQVIVWRGPKNNNTHCTKNLDMSSWTTAKS